YAGDPNAVTPNLDALASRSVNFVNAVSGCPVCSPYRASLLTGQYPLTHGVFINDTPLSNKAVSIAEAYKGGGYDTAYIGKWHVDGHGCRSGYIPPSRQQGFDFWKVLECSHEYNDSYYYAGDSDEKLTWDGYDAFAQTRETQEYLRRHNRDKPFLLMLSWGPPHAPYQTAPPEYRELFSPEKIVLRPNVPQNCAEKAKTDLAGYYAHAAALDHCIGQLQQTMQECNLEEDTIFIFTSDHGDMLGSQGNQKKQQPWEESIRIPFLLRYPAALGNEGRVAEKFIDAPDIMPTLLSLCDIDIPDTAEGADQSKHVRGEKPPQNDAVLLSCPCPFGQWLPAQGGREYRGVRTGQYTYTRDLDGPWLLYDNLADPYQLENLVGRDSYGDILADLEQILQQKLDETNDQFLRGEEYTEKWGYQLDERGTMPYEN
ncbi:MAG: sulfatase, partial [Phycisphaerae bacterium]|nr:sulfatase [Phycisphaerae bacterium]